MIGGPGSGKSTYSEFLSKNFKIPHIYTGDMMRALQKTNPEVAEDYGLWQSSYQHYSYEGITR